MIDWTGWIYLPLLIPLVTAIATLLAGDRIALQRRLSLAGSGGLLAATLMLLFTVSQRGILAVQIGGWPAPFGITLVADLFSAIMAVMAGLLGLAIAIYSLATIDLDRERYGYHTLFHTLLLGINGSFLTGDLFNLFVWFEIMLISSFVLLALGGMRAQLEGAIKYVTLNLLASAFFLTALGVLYGIAGSLNMADLALSLPQVQPTGMVTTVAMLFLVAFGIKSAIFPLFFWLPAAYHTAPAPISALFAGLLTKVGVYALIRVFTLLFVQDMAFTHTVLLVLAGLTMVVGVLGAAAQGDMRRILSFHIVSQIGYMLMGLALWTPLALTGTIFFMVHNILAKTNLFLVSGLVGKLRGTEELARLGGLYRLRPILASLFLIPALSLAGLPPFSGFWAKLALVQAGLAVEQYVIVAVSLGVSLLTLYSMTKIWAQAFWKEREGVDPLPGSSLKKHAFQEVSLTGAERWSLYGPTGVLVAITLALGLFAEPMLALATQAASQLLDPTLYIQAVLGLPQ